MGDHNEPGICPECGAVLPPGVPSLHCPFCLAGGGEGEGWSEEPGFELLGEIARGGMAVVYRARQRGLNRVVALKILPGAAQAAEEFRTRFQREVELIARLRHPNVIVVHETGVLNGQPFLAMEYIAGGSLADRLRTDWEGRSSYFAGVVARVAEALVHAHAQGVAHRDLKPSNILLGENDRVVLADFGLARLAGGTGERLAGTPAYMPPERISGKEDESGMAGDVYGLGAVLYHCLTGRPPHVGDSVERVLRAVEGEEPVPPRRLNVAVPADLETVCMKCLERNPAERYASAREVADDLGRFLRGEPVRARRVSSFGRLVRYARRKPLVAGLVTALAAVVPVAALISMAGWKKAAALAEQRRVELYSANMAAASAALGEGQAAIARTLLERCKPAPGETDLRGPEWRVIEYLTRPQELSKVAAHGHIATALAWSPDGTRLLTGAHDGSLRCWTVGDDGGLRLAREVLPGGSPRIAVLRWVNDGAFIVGSAAGVCCRELSGKEYWRLPGVMFSQGGGLLAVSTASPFYYEAGGNCVLYEWSGDPATSPQRLREIDGAARHVALSGEGRFLAVSDDPTGLRIWDLFAPESAPVRLPTIGPVWQMRFSPDGREIVVFPFGPSGFERIELGDFPHTTRVTGRTALRVSDGVFDDGSLLTAGCDRTLTLWSADGRAVRQLLVFCRVNNSPFKRFCAFSCWCSPG